MGPTGGSHIIFIRNSIEKNFFPPVFLGLKQSRQKNLPQSPRSTNPTSEPIGSDRILRSNDIRSDSWWRNPVGLCWVNPSNVPNLMRSLFSYTRGYLFEASDPTTIRQKIRWDPIGSDHRNSVTGNPTKSYRIFVGSLSDPIGTGRILYSDSSTWAGQNVFTFFAAAWPTSLDCCWLIFS